jgi:hypothetical protein
MFLLYELPVGPIVPSYIFTHNITTSDLPEVSPHVRLAAYLVFASDGIE